MIKIKISTAFPGWPLLRQTPHSEGIWGSYQFFVDQDIEQCDYWVVYGGILREESAICSINKTIFIAGEPPSVKRYDPKFLKQFAFVISCHKDMDHPRVINTQIAQPWHVGREQKSHINISFTKDYDELKYIKVFKKSKVLSVISSDKAFTEGHQKRVDFVKELSDYFGPRIDVFGRGIREIGDKWDAIADYKYHIAIENSCFPDYWTEKLADAYLGGSFPIYYGCPNLEKYYTEGSFVRIDIDNVPEAIKMIEKCIESRQYERSIQRIAKAKDLVLDKYNLFPMAIDFIEKHCRGSHQKKQKLSLMPENRFIGLAGHFKKIARSLQERMTGARYYAGTR